MTHHSDKIITIAKLGRPHGLKGWMRLTSYTNPPENVLEYPNLFIQQQNQWTKFDIEACDIRNNNILIKIKTCNTPEETRAYTHAEIGILRKDLPSLNEDEYYWTDLEGLTVINQQGIILGKVDHLFETGANDIIVIKGEKEHLLPYIKDVVLNVNLENKQITVDWDPDF